MWTFVIHHVAEQLPSLQFPTVRERRECAFLCDTKKHTWPIYLQGKLLRFL